MASDPSALLVVDVGTLFTHVALIDQVVGEYRVVARTEALSTLEPPDADAWPGIAAAIRELEHVAAHQILRSDSPIVPQRPDGSGVDAIVVVSSAAGTLPVVIAAISNNTTGASLRRIARATYTTVLGTVTLDERGATELAEGESWIDYQLTKLAKLPPATVLMAGGIEGGNAAPLERLAHMLAFTVLRREQNASRENAHVIFAGNSAALQGVESALSTIVPITPTENVRPSLEEEHLIPARLEISRLYTERVLPKLPGMGRLRAMTTIPMRTTADGFVPLVRFISQQHQRQVLIVDVGAMTTSCFASNGQSVAIAVETNCGTAYGAGGVLDHVGPTAITRWLPFEMSDNAIREHILNRLLRPQIIPITQEEMFVEHAIAREAMGLAMAGLRDEEPDLTCDLVIAGGGALTHVAHPAEALLMILDGLQLDNTNSLLVTDIQLDWDGLLPMCGALSWTHPDAAFCVLEQDTLRNGPLASCIVASGAGKPGELAVEAELTLLGGAPITLQVLHGEIRRLPLAAGRRATLRLRPARGVRIGANEPGAEVQSDAAALHGSTLGIVIDARGRQFAAQKGAPSREQQWAWLAQLGAVPSANPYQAAARETAGFAMSAPRASEADPAPSGPSELPTREKADVPDWLRSDLEDEGLVQPPPEAFGVEELPPWLAEDAAEPRDNVMDLGERGSAAPPPDFSELRAELNQEKPKRGFFGRKK